MVSLGLGRIQRHFQKTSRHRERQTPIPPQREDSGGSQFFWFFAWSSNITNH